MLNAIGVPGMYGATEEALAAAVERAVAALGLGTILALALAALVLGVEALARRWARQAKARPLEPRKGRRAASR